MTSAVEPKLPPVDPDDKDAYPLSTGRAHPKARKLIDIAAAHAELSRADFMLAASFQRAIEIVGQDQAAKILTEAAA